LYINSLIREMNWINKFEKNIAFLYQIQELPLNILSTVPSYCMTRLRRYRLIIYKSWNYNFFRDELERPYNNEIRCEHETLRVVVGSTVENDNHSFVYKFVGHFRQNH
jgi:hypothetical protein